MKTKEQILCEHLGSSTYAELQIEDIVKIGKAMEEYADRFKIKLTSDHCVCTGDQYGWAVNPNCLLHGTK